MVTPSFERMSQNSSTTDGSETRMEWFPMRVTYSRELKLKTSLDHLGIENFIPMHYEYVGEGQKRRLELVPAIHNLIFVRCSQERLTELKMTNKDLLPLRYMMRPVEGTTGKREIIRVPDKQMENFMRVATVKDDKVMFLEYGSYLDKPGSRVKVTKGFFAGVEGTVKRISNNRRVVVKIDGVAAVAITNVPVEYLMEANDG